MVRSVRPAGKCNDRRVLALTSDVTLLKCAAVPPVMKLCLFVAFAGFTFCQILSLADPVKKEPARHIRAVTGGRQLLGVVIRRTST